MYFKSTEKTRMKSPIFTYFLMAFLWSVGSATAVESTPLKVVTTFSILDDLVRQVGGDKIEVTSIVGPNSDTHVFEPTPRDLQNLTHADLIFMNGLFFEGWMDRLIDPTEVGKRVFIVSKHIKPRTHEHQNCTHSTHPDAIDPHAWHAIPNAISYIHEIEQALSDRCPEHKDFFHTNAVRYSDKLSQLHTQLRKAFAQVPLEKRVAVTTHDGFGYLGDTYGIRFMSPLGLSTETEASAKSLAQVIEEIRDLKVTMVFVENITSNRLMQQLCEETGASLGPILYSDALSEASGPASTYVDMMIHNTDILLKSMSPTKSESP